MTNLLGPAWCSGELPLLPLVLVLVLADRGSSMLFDSDSGFRGLADVLLPVR